MTIFTDPRCLEYSSAGHPERPNRVRRTVEFLQRQTAMPLHWDRPAPATESSALRAHQPRFLDRLRQAGDFDADTPAHPNILDHALRSVGGALATWQAEQRGEPAFSLLRPPGHHATPDTAMGFCYLNSAAIVALEAVALGISRVAVFDFDVHHGNGTEAILQDQPSCGFFSVHQYPAYPGTGSDSFGNSSNYPVPPGAPRQVYRAILARALDDLREYRPKLVVVSAGFDAYRHDPLSEAALEQEDFHWLGVSLRSLGVPLCSVLEGGYSDDLPELVFAYLQGMTESRSSG